MKRKHSILLWWLERSPYFRLCSIMSLKEGVASQHWILQCCCYWHETGAKWSKKVAGGIIGQTKQNAFMTEWELAYHKFLAPVKAAVTSQDQFWQRQMQQHRTRNCEAITWRSIMKQWNSFWFFKERGNPWKVAGPVKLHHFISNQVVPSSKSVINKYCLFWGNGSKKCMKFREERFPKKGLLTL